MRMKNHKKDPNKTLYQIFIDKKDLAAMKDFCRLNGLLVQRYIGDMATLGWNTPVLQGVDTDD